MMQWRIGRGGSGHPDPEISGGHCLKKNYFQPFGPQFGLKLTKGGEGGWEGTRALPWIRHRNAWETYLIDVVKV